MLILILLQRTYGKWWDIIPSTPAKIGHSETWFEATDFVGKCLCRYSGFHTVEQTFHFFNDNWTLHIAQMHCLDIDWSARTIGKFKGQVKLHVPPCYSQCDELKEAWEQ